MTATSTDIEKRIAVNPATGEAVDLALGTDTVARARREVIDLKRDLDDFAHDLDEEINARMDAENHRSAVIEDGSGTCRWEIKTKPAMAEEWPVADVGAAIDTLIGQKKLAASVKDRVLVPQDPPAPKLAKRELSKLLAHPDPEVVAALAACKRMNPQNRTVSVTRVEVKA